MAQLKGNGNAKRPVDPSLTNCVFEDSGVLTRNGEQHSTVFLERVLLGAGCFRARDIRVK